MTRRLLLRFAAISTTVAVSASLPAQAFAWGDDGHEIVASIAWALLDPAVQTKVTQLLNDDAADTLTKPDFVSRATWADKYRDSDRPHGPRYEGTHNWHFVDIPLSTLSDPASIAAAEGSICPHPTLDGQNASLGAPSDDCVVDKIRQFEAELANTSLPESERIFALKFLLHFVGDVHQPLHAADDNDQGANCVWVRETTHSAKVKLHAWWDNELIQHVENGRSVADTATALRNQITDAEKTTWQVNDPGAWGAESFAAAKSVSYNIGSRNLPTCSAENTKAPIVLPDGYVPTAEQTATEQLQKAGVRLAYVLNSTLGTP